MFERFVYKVLHNRFYKNQIVLYQNDMASKNKNNKINFFERKK